MRFFFSWFFFFLCGEEDYDQDQTDRAPGSKHEPYFTTLPSLCLCLSPSPSARRPPSRAEGRRRSHAPPSRKTAARRRRAPRTIPTPWEDRAAFLTVSTFGFLCVCVCLFSHSSSDPHVHIFAGFPERLLIRSRRFIRPFFEIRSQLQHD